MNARREIENKTLFPFVKRCKDHEDYCMLYYSTYFNFNS